MLLHLHQIIYPVVAVNTWTITTNRWDLHEFDWSLMHRLTPDVTRARWQHLCRDIMTEEKTPVTPRWHSVFFFSKRKHNHETSQLKLNREHWLVVASIHWILLTPSLCFHSSRHKVYLTVFIPETKARHTPSSPLGAAWESDSVTGCPAVTMTGWPLNSTCQLQTQRLTAAEPHGTLLNLALKAPELSNQTVDSVRWQTYFQWPATQKCVFSSCSSR